MSVMRAVTVVSVRAVPGRAPERPVLCGEGGGRELSLLP